MLGNISGTRVVQADNPWFLCEFGSDTVCWISAKVSASLKHCENTRSIVCTVRSTGLLMGNFFCPIACHVILTKLVIQSRLHISRAGLMSSLYSRGSSSGASVRPGVLRLDAGGIQECWEVKSKSWLKPSFSKNLELLPSRVTLTWYPLTLLANCVEKRYTHWRQFDLGVLRR